MQQWGMFFSKAKPWKIATAVLGTLLAAAVVAIVVLAAI